MNRTDGAMVRVIASVGDSVSEGRPKASELARKFAETLFPMLGKYLPT